MAHRPAWPYPAPGSVKPGSATIMQGWNALAQPPAPPALTQDHFLDGKASLSSQQVLGFLMGGFVLAFGGRSIVQLLSKAKVNTSSATPFDPNILDSGATDSTKLTVYQNYNNALSSIYRLIQLDPRQGNALLAYVATCILGYLSGGVMQGAKETWVRQQETKIRAHLINRLQTVVRQSIHDKYEFNAAFKNNVRLQIANLLSSHQIPNLNYYLEEIPALEPKEINRRFFYEPTHRTLAFGASSWPFGSFGLSRSGGAALAGPVNRFGASNSAISGDEVQKDAGVMALQKAVLFGVGAVGGFVLQGFIKLLFNANTDNDSARGTKEVWESIQLKDEETWAMIGSKSRKNFAIMSGFFAMSAAASVGKLLWDGLREIEVTRLNARTEYGYQSHNWLSQDPLFHRIAEEEAASNELKQLQIDLVCLKTNPPMLRQRVQSILLNIGRNSAPPYYPMTPTVGLVEARA